MNASLDDFDIAPLTAPAPMTRNEAHRRAGQILGQSSMACLKDGACAFVRRSGAMLGTGPTWEAAFDAALKAAGR